MKNLMAICLLGLLSVSCVTNKSQSEISHYSLGHNNEDEVMKECGQINQTGNIFQLLADINSDTRSVLYLLEQKSFSGIEDSVHELALRIKENSILVKQLSKTEWSKPDVRHSIKWTLSEKDFSRNQYVFYPEIKNVYFQGQERPDLIKRVTIDQNGNNFVIEYMNAGTLLEYCQLNETLMLVLEVKTGSFKNPKKKLFNLFVNLEN